MMHLKLNKSASKKAYLLLSVISVVFLIFIFCGSQDLTRPKKATSSDIQRKEGTIKVDGLKRHYVLYIPRINQKIPPLPLVFVLHGARSNPKGMQILSEFQELEMKQKFITVYPAAEGKFWDDGREKVSPKINDVKFINALVDTLSARYHINRHAVFAAGMSNGATMSVRLACQSKKIEAIAAVASTAVQQVMDNCQLDQPKPAMFIKGTHDPIANFNGVEKRKRDIVGFREVVQKFRTMDGCSDQYVNSPIPDSTDDGTYPIRKRYKDCSDDAEVVSIVVQNGGHTWPGAPPYRKKFIVGRTSHDFSATKVIWNFFRRHIP